MANDNTNDADLRFLRRSLELAAEGVGRVSPNPLVGCVIVADNALGDLNPLAGAMTVLPLLGFQLLARAEVQTVPFVHGGS